MGKVFALEETVIRQIAAGEVVERPSSVVKELLENSLDAGSKRITLEIGGSGKEFIRVSDDGCGMDNNDAALALERHTTSKIRAFNDLETIRTFGFRGEALPSIASVSKLTLTTRPAQEPHGVKLTVEGGGAPVQEECGRSVGTTVEIKNLFFNVPARLKFLKSDATERGKILQALEETALANPETAFEFKDTSSERKPLSWPARPSVLERMTDIWGDAFTSNTLFALSFDHPHIKITGWVSKPESHQSAKNRQLFFVNRRPVQSRSLTHALYEAFRDGLPVNRHPAALIFLDVDPAQVDVNVHPAKREVRFRNESQVYDALLREIRLKRSQLGQPQSIFSAPREQAGTVAEPAARYQTFSTPTTVRHSQQTFISAPSAVPAQNQSAHPSQPLSIAPKVMGQFHALYLVTEQGQDLVLVDQHAASERVIYERMTASLTAGKGVRAQPLLIPIILNVSPSRAEALTAHREALATLGFGIEPFGERAFRLTEAPSDIPETELKSALEEILTDLENRNNAETPLNERVLRISACRAAVKANDRMSAPEISTLLEDLARCENPHTCPHGRPTTLKISRAELDKKFGRNYDT